MYALQVKQRNYLKIAIVIGIIWVVGLAVSLFLYDALVDMVIKWQQTLKPGYIFRKLFLKPPFPFQLHLHIFDIKNKEEVAEGGKPILEDIGPYIFDERVERYDPVDNAEDDTLEYSMRKTYHFRPDLSNGLTGDEIVTTLHPLINGIGTALAVDKEGLLDLAAVAIEYLFHNPKDAFFKGRAMDLLFDGIDIDCSSDDFNAEAVCSVLPENPAIVEVTPHLFKFSLFGASNGSFNGRYKVKRGIQNIHDMGRIVELDGEEELDVWGTDEANQFQGTDALIAPPFLQLNKPIWVHERVICLNIHLDYERKTKVRGAPLKYFRGDFSDYAKDEEAFCRVDGKCPHAGTVDLFHCIGAPIVVSMVHLEGADPSVFDMIASGIDRNRPITENEPGFHFDLKTGVALLGHKRAQLNLALVPIPKIEVMKNLPEMLFPLIWLNEQVRFPFWWVVLFKALSTWPNRLIWLVKYLCFSLIPIAGIAALAIHFLIHYGQIEVIDEVEPIKQFVAETVETVVSTNGTLNGPEKKKESAELTYSQ